MQCLQQTLYMSSLHIFYSFIETLLMTNAINVAQYFYYDKKILRNHQLGFILQP